MADFQAGNAQALIDWYNSGADGQIDWGEEGDFAQCVAVAGDYIDDPEGFCQLRHIDATGEPAGKGAHGGATVKTQKQFGGPGSTRWGGGGGGSGKGGSLADKAIGEGWTKEGTDPKAQAQLHENIKNSVADAHGVSPSQVESKSTFQSAPGHITVTTDHGDGTTTTTGHGIVQDNEGNLALGGHSTDDNASQARNDTQVAAVHDALTQAGVKGDGTFGPPPKRDESVVKHVVTADANLPEPIVDAENNSFAMPIMVIEGTWTGDWRWIDSGSLTWRDLPIPAMALTQTTDTHSGADLVGQITSIERQEFAADVINSKTGEPYPPGTSYLVGKGKFANNAKASEISDLVRQGFLRGVSVDIGDAVSDIMMVDQFGNEVEDDGEMDLFDILFGFTADGEEAEAKPKNFMGEKIRSGRVMGATICPFPAFEGAYVTVGDVAMAASARVEESGPSIVTIPTFSNRKSTGLTAAAPMRPPIRWFSNPGLTCSTAIEVGEDGRVKGHLASWTECHMGYQSTCVNAPHSQSDYAYFHVGCVLTDEGVLVPTGTITMNTGHAELWQEKDSAKAHYDNTGTVVADICAGEDNFGIWVAGALRPDVDELSVRRLRGAALSGDWRQVGGQLELVAALAVNVPGFPITRPKARVASGMPQSLVAAGRVTHEDAQRLKVIKPKPATDLTLQAATAILERQARNSLRAEVHPR